jgi:Flp pilus assembly protein TadG
MFAVLLLPMMLLVGLVVDGGRALVVQRRAQATVDAAAVAAAMAVDEGNFKDTNHVQLDGTDAQTIADH